MRIDFFKKMLVLLAVPVTAGAIWAINAFSQTEVSTQVVGFVREVDNGAGVFRYAMIPFAKLNEPSGIRRHYLNKMNQNGTPIGVHDPGTDGIFDTVNFTDSDTIRKFESSTGGFTKQARLLTFGGSGRTGYTVPGWYDPKPFSRWALSSNYFDDGEAYVIQYKTAPADTTTHGKIINYIGEFDNSDIVTTMIKMGYNPIGNPFPVNLHVTQAFNQFPDNDSTLPIAGTGTNPSVEPTGDLIRIGYLPATNTWKYTLRYWRHATDGKGWYYQSGPIWRKVPTNTADSAYANFYLEPGKGFLYYAKVPFYWKVKAPQM